MRHRSALEIVATALAVGMAPPQEIAAADWAKSNLIVADGPRSGQKWDPDLTPQLIEPLNMLSSTTGHTQVALRKSAQIGATVIGIAWMGSIAANNPAKAMVIFPTITSVQDYNREKLQPTIEASPALKIKIRKQTTRSSRGSTALSKVFPGGSLVLTGANSSVDLRSKTVKFQHRDEIDDWPLDLEGQGDPEEMADARLISFHATGDYMVFKSSTPTIKGQSRIDAAYENGDQRRWMVACPHCGAKQDLVFGGKNTKHGLKFNTSPPYSAHYVCRENGCVIDHHEKPAMIRAGEWVATNDDGLYPSYHLDAISSLLTTWDKIAEAFLKAKDDPVKLKAFVNLWLGESWEERGDAPEWQQLMLRRADYPRGVIPAGGLVFTLAVDVQGNGLFYEVVAWGRDKQSWSVDIGFLEGDTADPSGAVWKNLTELSAREYPDQRGGHWPVDQIAVDSGFNTFAVYHWVSRHPKAMAVKGMPNWYAPAIGTPSKQSATYSGKKTRKVLLWPVGTWQLKASFYAYLRKQGIAHGEDIDPAGYCHFSKFHDERFFRQLTAEYIREKEVKGRMQKEWIARGDNHFHDCRIYGMAAFDRLGGNAMTPAQWDELAEQRGGINLGDAPGLFDEPVKPKKAEKQVRKSSLPRKRGGFVGNW